jgi:hypothetical protein
VELTIPIKIIFVFVSVSHIFVDMSLNRSHSSSPIPLRTLQRPSSPAIITAVSSTLSIVSSNLPQQSPQQSSPNLTFDQAVPQNTPNQISPSIIHRLIKPVSKIVKSFSRSILFITLAVAMFGIVLAWKSYVLDQWTARKDFLEYCRSYNVTNPGFLLFKTNR